MAYLGNQPKDPISVSTTAPSNPKNGAVWFNSALGETFVYYDDGTTAQWVQTNPAGQQGPAGPTGPAGANGEVVRTELDAYLQVANLSSLSTSIIPSANVTYDLGSTTNYWKDLYLSGNTIFLGSSQITLNANGGIDLPSGSRMGGTLIGSGSGGGASVTIADTAPGSPSAGDLWWSANTSELFIYYNDTDTSQWVQATTPGATGPAGADGSSVTAYANTSAFPSSGNSVGDFAFATNTKAVYIWDGLEWDRISAGVDESPIILTEPPTTHTLSNAGTNTSLTMLATDPEGFDITYGIAYKNAGSTLPAQLLQAPVINQSNGVFTFIPTSNTSLDGSFTARLSASDGVKTTTRLVDFSLTFAISADFLVVAGGGGGAGWGGGGGGAGGLRTSYGSLSGGGASAESSAAFAPGQTYTITIGDGGIGGGSAGTTNYEGVDGANSSIIGSGVSIISIGGGGGGGGNAATVGRDGGSGGGGGTNLAGGSGTAGQGYAGGFGDSDGGHPYGHAGGGGAGAVGFDDAGSTTDSGAGGAGLQVNIDGNNYYWAGGGGGGAHNGSGTRFSDGGIGGGGGGSGYEDFGAGGGSALNSGQNGATYGSGVGAGGTNTGGGGGASAGGARVGGQGGSGIVIIRAAQAASSTTGSPTVTTVGSDTVYTFTSDGSITF